MFDDGTITIKTSNIRLGAPERPEEPAPGDYVMCSVADAGTGISDDILDKVFEPFFTTKEVGKGSGLGLPQVLGVAKQLGGGVRIQTRRGVGTTVNVYLPRAHEDLAPSEALAITRQSSPNPDAISSRTAMVLLVDDDNDVRAAAAGMLRYAGHDVIEAANGREALDYLGREGDRIDLMIVDFVMPRMNGVEVARRARLSRPSLPILFVTGFANTAALAAQTDSELILRKPFRTTELVAKIGEALRSVPAGL